jgi:predicted MFS family arabinose efflux permease
MSLTAGFGILGKLSFGWLADYWRARSAVWLTIACQIAGQLLMFQTDRLWLFAMGAALFGYGMGGVVPLQGALVARLFGRRRFGQALGSMRPAMFPLQIAGVPLAGWIFDTTGSYRPAFVLFIVLYLLAASAALAFRDRPDRDMAG